MDEFATSNKNITYYVGAGASAEALPLVNDLIIENQVIRGIPYSFREFARSLAKDTEIKEANFKYRDYIMDNLHDFADQSELFGTIDTYAKYLFLNDKERLRDLKNTLIFFFLHQQCLKFSVDKRALIFLTTILQHNSVFPSNINIISWNYDFQIETAAQRFVIPKFDSVGGSFKRTPPLIEHFPANGVLVSPEYKLVHLNGCAGYYKSENYSEYVYDGKIKDINSLFDVHKNGMTEFLNFAWENNEVSETAIQRAEQIAQKTDVLVVIGYTFPVFNREIDRRIFQQLKSKVGLKIYFQDPLNEGKFLQDQFELHHTTKIIPISNVRNYHIPIEL